MCRPRTAASRVRQRAQARARPSSPPRRRRRLLGGPAARARTASMALLWAAAAAAAVVAGPRRSPLQGSSSRRAPGRSCTACRRAPSRCVCVCACRVHACRGCVCTRLVTRLFATRAGHARFRLPVQAQGAVCRGNGVPLLGCVRAGGHGSHACLESFRVAAAAGQATTTRSSIGVRRRS